MGAVQAGVECFVEDRARGRRLLADSEGGTFENLAFLPRHAQRLRLGSRANHVFGPQSEPAAMTLGP